MLPVRWSAPLPAILVAAVMAHLIAYNGADLSGRGAAPEAARTVAKLPQPPSTLR
jgi:hypothetical protein